mgnify:CR=1 FL=1
MAAGLRLAIRRPTKPALPIIPQCQSRSIDELFSFGKELGRGSYGVVRMARPKAEAAELFTSKGFKPPTHVAIKTIIARDSDEVEDLAREIAIMSHLSFEHSLQYYGCFQQDKTIHIVMEYFEGRELFDLTAIPVSATQVLQILYKIALAVQELHDHNIIHRDLKLENVMIGPDETIKLIDYGSACDLGRDSCGSGEHGSPEYSDPVEDSSLIQQEWWAFGQLAATLILRERLYQERTGSFRAMPGPKGLGSELPARVYLMISRLVDPKLSLKLRPTPAKILSTLKRAVDTSTSP